MLKKVLGVLFFSIATSLFAQVTNEGVPRSWNMSNVKSEIKAIKLPPFDLQKIKAEDEINDNNQAKPFRFGYKHHVDYGLNNAGYWNELPNGDRIWRILFESENALSLNFSFDKFVMPKGGKVYLYSDDRSDLLGAYTEIQNQKSEVLSTWIVKGHKVWIEYFEPKQVKGQAQLHISTAVHGYRSAQTMKTLGESGDCNHDVDCPIGSDFESHRDLLKKAVTLLLVNEQDWCTGTLINNTTEDKTPYVLTANHCLFDESGTQRFSTSFISARFNWISPIPVCAATTASTNGPTNMTISGSTLKANNSDSDVVLLELSGAIPNDWDVTYAGWDRSDTTPSFVVSIHHPQGDIMKISRDDSGVIKAPHSIDGSPVAQTWEITTAGGGWELGVTEQGSSGSALFDNDGRIIGQLFGGGALCAGLDDNGALDFYGRFAVSWNSGSTAATRLSDWLNPAGIAPITLNSLENVLAVNDEFLEQNITIYPNPTTGEIFIDIGNNPDSKFTITIATLTGQTIYSKKINFSSNISKRLDLSRYEDGIYYLSLFNVNQNLIKKIILN